MELISAFMFLPWYMLFLWLVFMILMFGASLRDESLIILWPLVFLGTPFVLFMGGNLGNAFQTIINTDIWTIFRYVGGWVVIGVVYSFFRFFMEVRDRAKSMESYARKDFDTWNKSVIEGGYTGSYRKSYDNFHTFLVEQKGLPSFSTYKMNISNWIIWWPFSAIGYFLSDFIYRILKNVLKPLEFVYNFLSNLAINSSGIK